VLKDFERPQRLYQVDGEGLATDFPALRALAAQEPVAVESAGDCPPDTRVVERWLGRVERVVRVCDATLGSPLPCSPTPMTCTGSRLGLDAPRFRDGPDTLRARRTRLLAAYGARLLDIPNKRGGLIPPLMPGHDHDLGIGYEPERARSLLAEAGHQDGDGIAEIVVIVFDFVPQTAVEELRAQLAEISIQSRFELVPFRRIRRSGQAARQHVPVRLDPDVPDPSAVFDPTFVQYSRVYRDDALVELVVRARTETDRNERLRLYREIDRIVVAEHASIVPVSYRRTVTLRRSWVSGYWADGYFDSALDEVVVDAKLRDRLRR
jgi:hypothetical protein